MVELLLTPLLLEQIITKFGNDVNYETYTLGKLFMMALNTCNASVQHDIAGVQTKFNSLILDSYVGKDITRLVTEAL